MGPKRDLEEIPEENGKAMTEDQGIENRTPHLAPEIGSAPNAENLISQGEQIASAVEGKKEWAVPELEVTIEN